MHMSSSWERPSRGKTPSFSSSLLESIYHSIDESQGHHDRSSIRRNNSSEVGQEIASLRRAIMVEKWMENCTNKNATPAASRHFNSDSNSSTDSMASVFSSSEAESSASRSSVFAARKPKTHREKFVKTTARKSNILSFYGELKKTKQPISPGRKICNFLSSIFTSKNKPHHREEDDSAAVEEWSSVRKSRSMKASTTAPSCLSKTPSSKSKRSVRFCPVNVILNDNHNDNVVVSSFRDLEVKSLGKVVVRGMYNDDDEEDDGRSCASSDLFELENIGTAGSTHHHHHVDASRDELPVYGTTSLKINQAIASGLFM